jgi:hypothetical protein
MPVSMPVMPVSVPTFDTVAMLTVRTPLHLLAQKEKMSNEDLVSTFDTAGIGTIAKRQTSRQRIRSKTNRQSSTQP